MHINNFNFKNVRLRLVNDEYWDFFLSTDEHYLIPSSTILTGDTLAAYINFGDQNSYSTGSTSANTIISTVSWVGAYNSGATLSDIGLTGMDNGYLNFNSLIGTTGNTAFLSAFTGSSVTIPSGDTKLTLHKVSGYTTPFITSSYVLNGDFTSSASTGNTIFGWVGDFSEFGNTGWTQSNSGATITATGTSAMSAYTLIQNFSTPLPTGKKYDLYFDLLSTGSTIDLSLNSGATVNSYSGISGTSIYYPIDLRYSGSTPLSSITFTAQQLISGCTGCTLQGKISNVSIKTYSGYTYPISIIPSNSGTSVGQYAQFCGGFYQGFYKLDNFPYQTLPNRVPKSWVTEFWLNKNSCSATGTTLNDSYPNNKGFIFYMGTRAENKFWNTFYGLNTGTTSACTSSQTTGSTSGITTGVTQWCTTPKEIDLYTSVGTPVRPNNLYTKTITNKFLIYDRSVSGKTTSNFSGDSITITGVTKTIDNSNKFLSYSRAATGLTANCKCSPTGSTINSTNYLSDLIDNAFGIRVKDDGSVGYRSLTMTGVCSGNTYITGVTTEEQYSISGLVSDNKWTHLAIKMEFPTTLKGCDLITSSGRTGNMFIYINGKLKSKLSGVTEHIGKRLVINYEKQEAVPYNISIGGGSHGLLESITLDGLDVSDRNLPIETNFAGTFIGGISKFRFYVDNLCYCAIKGNFDIEAPQYGASTTIYPNYRNYR